MLQLNEKLVERITDFIFEQLWPTSEHGLNHPDEVSDPDGLLLLRSVCLCLLVSLAIGCSARFMFI